MLPIEKPGTPEELVHFGVKGMRWGVRKSETSSNTGSNAKARKAISKEAHKNNAPAFTKTKAWKSWSKLAQKNVDHYNSSKVHRVGSEAALGVLVVIGALTVRNIRR